MKNVSPLALPRLKVDFETYSDAPLKGKDSVGAWRYAEDPSTEILCLGYRFLGDKGDPSIWWPDQPFPQEIIEHIKAGYAVSAHNAQFEIAIWTRQLNEKLGIPMPKFWIDTMASCAYRALPLSLEDAGEVLNLEVKKDKRGKFLLDKLAKPQKVSKKQPLKRIKTPELIKELGDYCKNDVVTEEELAKKIGDLPLSEYKLWILDQKINKRGVFIDREAVLKAMDLVQNVSKNLEAELSNIINIQDSNGNVLPVTGKQTEVIRAWCNNNGCNIPNMQAETVEQTLKHDWLSPEVRRALEIRQSLSKSSVSKLNKFHHCVCNDGRIRGLLQYHGAGTGRWSGRLVQPQNFPRGSVKSDKSVSSADLMEIMIQSIKTNDAESISAFVGNPLDVVSSSLRGMIQAEKGNKLFVADFSAIEARVLMWLAECHDGINAFVIQDTTGGTDIYCEMAQTVYQKPINKKDNPVERHLGKTLILGCGYQMSGSKLLIQSEADLARVGIKLTPQEADKYVSLYRDKYEEVPQLWRGLEQAAVECVQTRKRTGYKKIWFEYVVDKAGPWLTLILPGGEKLWYYKPFVEPRTIPFIDKITGERATFTKDNLSFWGKDSKKGGTWSVVSTYGGMLTENAVQAIARNLLVSGMWRCEQNGYPIVLTVHDEVVSERPDDGKGSYKELESILSGPLPPWAKGCPVAAEGWEGYRYRK